MALAFVAIWNGWIGYMPDMEDLQNPISKYASQVYSVDGKILGTYNLNRENRVHVDYDKLSPNLIRALVATEDERFYEHSPCCSEYAVYPFLCFVEKIDDFQASTSIFYIFAFQNDISPYHQMICRFILKM